MRRIFALLLCFVLFATTAYAENAASGVQAVANVSADGSCQISLSMTVRLENPVDELEIPLGQNVSNVQLNGISANLRRSGGFTSVKLTGLGKGVTGTVPVAVSYTVNSVVVTDEKTGARSVAVPLMAGFSYPVEQVNFTVTMPGTFDAVPTFLSGYHEQDIESHITSEVQGATVTGTVNTTLKDHETLTMTLAVPEGMFPQGRAAGGSLSFDATAMIVLGVLAALYWLAFLADVPRFPLRRSTPPVGVNAGTVGCYLVHRGADLTMMVLSWAQLGYLFIHLDDNGRVLLHRKMEMGNERSAFEGRVFRDLFGKNETVDATGYRFARLSERVSASSARFSWGMKRGFGNADVLRLLGCGVCLFAGVAIGDSLTSSPAWRVLLMLFLGAGGAVGGWYIQKGMQFLRLRDRLELWVSLGCCALFLALGHIAMCPVYAWCAVGGQLLIGLMAANSGRRTENGKRTRDEILGLRRYMRRVSKAELMRILRTNPDYYYTMAPYALALGVDKKFARNFGSLRLPGCTWLIRGMERPNTAGEFAVMLRDAAEAMTNLQKRPPWEKFLNLK